MASGALFKVKEKKGDRHPDYTGKIDVDADLVKIIAGGAQKLDVAGWMRESPNGLRYISFVVKPPYEAGASKGPDGPAKSPNDEMPF